MPCPAARLEGQAGSIAQRVPSSTRTSLVTLHPGGQAVPGVTSQQSFQNKTAPDMLGLVRADLATSFQAQRAPTLFVSLGPFNAGGLGQA